MSSRASTSCATANEDSTSGINSVLTSIQPTITALIKPIIAHMKTIDSSGSNCLKFIVKSLKKFVISNSLVSQAFEKVAILSKLNPKKSFQEVTKFLFKIPLLPEQPLSSTKLGVTHWISRLGEKDMNNLRFRVILFYVVENYIADIVYKMLLITENENIDFLVDEYFDPIISSLTDSTKSCIYSIMTDKYELIVNQLSLKAPTRMWKWAISFIKKPNSDHIDLFVYRTLRSFTLKNVPRSEVESDASISAFQNTLPVFATPQNLTENLIAMSLFFTAITADILVVNWDKRPTRLITVIFNSATAVNSQRCPVLFPLMCTFFALSDELRVSMSAEKITTAAQKLAKQVRNTESLIFYGLKRILCGPNYLPHCEEDSEATLNWRIDKRDAHFLAHFFPIVNLCALESPSSELASFLTQLAVNDMDKFVSQYIVELQTSNFMKINGIAVFETGKRLIPLGSEELNKIFTELCIHFIGEFGGVERTTTVPGIPTEVCEIDQLFETSDPIIPTTIVQKKMMQDVSKLQKAISPESKAALTYTLKVALKLSDDCMKSDSPLARCISIVPLLNFSEELTSFVISRIYDKSAFIASLAARCLMLLSKKYPSKATHIASLILAQLPTSDEQLYIVVTVLKMIMSVIKDQQIINDLTEASAPIIIEGLCSVSYELRGETLNLIDQTPLAKFFEKHDNEITTLTLKKIASVFVSNCDIGTLQQLSFQSFREFASAKYEIIYHIYLSVVFSVLSVSEEFKYFQNASSLLTTIFTKLIDMHAQGANDAALYAINVATFLISTSEMNTTNTQSLLKTIGYVIPIINKHIQNEPFDVVLYSFAASVSKEHTIIMLKLLTGPNELYLRAFAFVAHLYVQNNNVVNDPDSFKNLLDLMDIVVQYCGSASLISNNSIETVKELSPLMSECINSFTHVVDNICQQFMAANTTATTGPFLHKPNTQKLMNREKWFFFMFNLAMLPDTFPEKLRTSAKNAFASFCSVNAIPDDLFQLFIDHILKIAPDNTLACSYILSHAFGFFLEPFINNSVTESHFFRCIALRFQEPRSVEEDAQILAAAALKPLNSSEQEFSDSVFAHLGDLLALCFVFLSGERPGFEKDSQKVLYHIILSGSLLVDSPKLSEAIDYIKDTSFTALNKLSEILSEAFSFCAEQFIACALSIIDGHSLTCYTCLIQPWFKHINLSPNADKLIQDTTPVFQRFTSTSFLQQFIRVVCTPPLQPPSISLLETVGNTSKEALEFILIYCFTAYTELREQCKAVLIHICKNNKELALKVSFFLQFRYWWYSVIQLRTFDRFFDFDQFLNEMKSEKQEEKTQSKVDPNIYEENSLFALEVCCELLPFYEEIRPFIISFCITKAKTEKISKALLLATGFEEPTVADIKQALGKNISAFFKECYNWGTSCGDTDSAVIAAKCASETVTEVTPDMIPHVLRALRVITATLRENSAPSEDKKQKKHLAKLLQGDSEVNLKLYYKHIAHLLDLLCEICKETKVSNPEILNAVCAFSACGDSEFQPIFESFVNTALELIGIQNTIKNSQVNGGILMNIASYNILIDKKKAKKIIQSLFKLTAIMFENGLYDALIPHSTKFADTLNEAGKLNNETSIDISAEMQIAASLLWLIPYIATDCNESMIRGIERRAAESLSIDVASIWTSFSQEGNTFSQSLSNTVSTLVNKAGPVLTSAIIKSYSLILSHTSRYSHPIYVVSALILETTTTPKELSMRRIALPALKEKEESCAQSVARFLTIYHSLCGNFEQLPSTQVCSIFPIESICPDLKKWEDGELPLYPIEYSFFYFNTIEELRSDCLGIRVEPFDGWTTMMFNAESLRVNQGSSVGVVPEVTSDTVTKFLNTINKDSFTAQESKVQIKRKQSHDEEFQPTESQSLLVVSSSTFLPTTDYINSIGIDITGSIF